MTKYAGAVGSSGFLECRVLCFPNAIFTWQFGGSNLVPNGRILIEYNGTTSTVMFTTVQASDHGLYTCTAANFAGSSSFDIQFLEPGNADVTFATPVLLGLIRYDLSNHPDYCFTRFCCRVSRNARAVV